MNYRERQIRLILNQEKAKWAGEKTILQQDIINLQNSTDIKLLEQAQQESKRLQKLLDDTVNLLGNEDIKNLSDLSNLLKGKSLKELATEKDLLTQKIKDQDTALIQLAKQKIKGKKEAEKLLNDLETKQSKKEIEWETEKENTSQELAKSREIMANLDKKLNYFKSTAQEIEKIINSSLVIFMGKEKVIGYLGELKE